MAETVAALSSGLVPSGVAVIRISGPQVRFALETICGVPEPRYASLRRLRHPKTRDVLDEALVLFFPGPNSFTGEDVAELHCHGGPAVVDAVLGAVWGVEGIRPAEAGDFTRQAFLNNRLDLTQVESLGDLISATTEAQRALAVDQLGGRGRDTVQRWKVAIIDIRVAMEADLDFSDEDDVPGSVIDSLPKQIDALLSEIETDLSDHFSERVRSGFKVVLAGAPNSGKSTLLNALIDRDAALVSSEAGTTRDRIDVAVDLEGLPVILSDTAGLRDTDAAGQIERLGMDKTREALTSADCIVWLEGGDDESQSSETEVAPDRSIRVRSKSDLETQRRSIAPGVLDISGVTGDGLAELKVQIAAKLRAGYSTSSSDAHRASVALDQRRRTALMQTQAHLQASLDVLSDSSGALDQAAEELRLAQRCLGEIVGDVDPEGLLDRLFSTFCIGK